MQFARRNAYRWAAAVRHTDLGEGCVGPAKVGGRWCPWEAEPGRQGQPWSVVCRGGWAGRTRAAVVGGVRGRPSRAGQWQRPGEVEPGATTGSVWGPVGQCDDVWVAVCGTSDGVWRMAAAPACYGAQRREAAMRGGGRWWRVVRSRAWPCDSNDFQDARWAGVGLGYLSTFGGQQFSAAQQQKPTNF
jgi:hypothetical protein